MCEILNNFCFGYTLFLTATFILMKIVEEVNYGG